MDNYPLENTQFIVEWGGDNIGFAEISGLTMTNDVIEYRDGASKEPGCMKMPGLRKYDNIILKRGVTSGNNNLYNWMNTIAGSAVARRDITITLLDASRNPVLVWRVSSAWPCRLSYSQLTGDKGSVMMEEVELAHEGFSISGASPGK